MSSCSSTWSIPLQRHFQRITTCHQGREKMTSRSFHLRHYCRDAHTKGYQAMGSFHSENVDDLMKLSDEEYQPPTLPFSPTSSSTPSTTSSSNDFLLNRKQWTFLNHGAFGAALNVGYDRAQQWRYHLEKQPLQYFDRELLPHLVYSTRRLANFVHVVSTTSSKDDEESPLTLIPNVTYGLNTILRGYERSFQQHHVILWDTTYGSLKKMAYELFPGRVTEIPVTEYFDQWSHTNNNSNSNSKQEQQQQNHDEMMNDPTCIFERALRDTLSNLDNDQDPLSKVSTKKNALLILDHTTSNTALNMPLQSLSKIAKEHDNMLVLVDGAHGILTQELQLNETTLPHVDFYLGNGHKWLCCPRGIGFMYCPRPDLRNTILRLPAVMSHGIGQGYHSRFLWDGCRDYAAALSLPAVLDYWESQQQEQEEGNDPTQFRSSIHNKLKQAVRILSQQWHGAVSEEEVEATLLAPWKVHAPMMALVRLPDTIQSNPSTSDDAKAVQDFLYDNFVEVPIKCVRGVLYVRISCHVYNELYEYERLGQIMLQYHKP